MSDAHGPTDPWEVLGLDRDATLAEARAARRRLAKQLHPDLHGARSASEQAALAVRMTLVNGALAAIEAAAASDGAGTPADAAAAPAGADAAAGAGTPADAAAAPGPEPATPGVAGGFVDAAGAGIPAEAMAGGFVDGESFSVERLPAEAFEALFVAAYGLGDILVADEPYLLELFLAEPVPCFCQLHLAPEAGGSLVTVDVSPALESIPAPDVGAVIEVLVAELNALMAT
jgi:hypothetical protein